MTINGWVQIALFIAIIIAITPPVGAFLAAIAEGRRNFLTPVRGPVERGIYRLAGVDPAHEQSWIGYAVSMLAFKVAGFVLLYAILRLQGWLPFNPAGQTAVPPDLAFNTATSFITNTNWQNYGGETTPSDFSQMAGLPVQNFVSAAAGIAIAMAFVRGFARRSASTIGNYWADLVRITLYVLLPICIVIALVFIWQGMPQTLGAYVDATTLEGAKQTIALGPVASQEVIKMLGTNGGGFFNVNSAHPFENPNVWSDIIEMLLVLIIPATLVFMYGRMVGSRRQALAIFATMFVMFI